MLNLAMYLVLCFMVGTGTVMWLRLPPGSGLGVGAGVVFVLAFWPLGG